MLYYCMRYKQDSWDMAVELMATQPNLTISQVAKIVDVNPSTLKMWKTDDEFNEALYKKTLNSVGSGIPSVMDSVKREAEAGNIQAARLYLEFAGKLQKHHVHTVTKSPYEIYWESAGIEANKNKLKTVDVVVVEPPKLKAPIPKPKKNKKKKALKSKPTERQREINRKKSLESYRRQQRAKKVGLEPLGRRKGTLREKWYAELEKREKEMEIKG